MTAQQENENEEHTIRRRLNPKDAGSPHREHRENRDQNQQEAEHEPKNSVLQLNASFSDAQGNDRKYRDTSDKKHTAERPA